MEVAARCDHTTSHPADAATDDSVLEFVRFFPDHSVYNRREPFAFKKRTSAHVENAATH